jgi:hypothetical protein
MFIVIIFLNIFTLQYIHQDEQDHPTVKQVHQVYRPK